MPQHAQNLLVTEERRWALLYMPQYKYVTGRGGLHQPRYTVQKHYFSASGTHLSGTEWTAGPSAAGRIR
jgi:hypothetical protein